jgi:MFS family permease
MSARSSAEIGWRPPLRRGLRAQSPANYSPPSDFAVILLSLFNIGGRLFWAALSDRVGRKTTYCIFFALGILLYAAVPWAAHSGSKALFVGLFCIIVSMYGGGFATIPAYLADLFGTQFVSAIHGRLLTAWSTAGIIGPVIINYLREFELASGVARENAYDLTMYILAAMLVLGFIANQMVKPLADHWFMSDKEVAALQAKSSGVTSIPTGSFGIGRGRFDAMAILAWTAIGIPMLWGVWTTLERTWALFR